MERYNPPSTSQQANCLGCVRQIRKVQECMNDQFIFQMNTRIDRDKIEACIRSLEQQVALERAQKRNLKHLYDNKMLEMGQKSSSEGANDETLRHQNAHLKKTNEELVMELEKLREATKQKPSTSLPFEEWKGAVKQYYMDEIESLTNTAFENKEMMKYMQAELEKKEAEVRDCRQFIRQQRNAIRSLKNELEEKGEEMEKANESKRRKEDAEEEEEE